MQIFKIFYRSFSVYLASLGMEARAGNEAKAGMTAPALLEVESGIGAVEPALLSVVTFSHWSREFVCLAGSYGI